MLRCWCPAPFLVSVFVVCSGNFDTTVAVVSAPSPADKQVISIFWVVPLFNLNCEKFHFPFVRPPSQASASVWEEKLKIVPVQRNAEKVQTHQ